MMEDFNHFDQLAEQFHTAISQVIRKSAFDIQAAAQTLAPVDTGNLKNSIYTKTIDGDQYPGGGSESPVDNQVPPVDDVTAYVAVGALYGVYVELGTTRMPSHPYLAPATESVRPNFEAAMGMIESKMHG
jgi:HK97 gp10 family phage protein